jgi:hypothetical protein
MSCLAAAKYSQLKHNQTNKPKISENTCKSFNQYSVSMMLVTKLQSHSFSSSTLLSIA